MKLSEHTPGPWHRDAGEITVRDRHIATVTALDDTSAAEDEANAILIAAAPKTRELLAWALETLELANVQSIPSHNGFDAAAVAIGMAEIREHLGA